MSTNIILIVISICFSLFGSYNYIRDTIKGKVRPNRVSQALWAIAPFIGVGAAISSGAAPITTIRTFMAGFVPLTIFIASFANKTGYWKTSKFDYACSVLSVIALILWLFAGLPIYAVIFAVLADIFASIPTIKKSWTNPESESGIAYIMSIFSMLVILPTIKTFDIQNSAFQIYILTVDIIITFCIYRVKIFKHK